MSTALVTGGAGFIGSHLVRSLLADGVRVRVLDDLSTGHRAHLDGLDVELTVGDVRDAGTVRSVAAGCSELYHLAAIASVPRTVAEPALSFAVNLGGTHQVLEAARTCGVERLIFASSAAVYGPATMARIPEGAPLRPQSPYGAEKAAGEQLVRAYAASYGMHAVSLRFFNVYGPRQDPSSPYSGVIAAFLGALVQGRIPEIHGDGSQSRDFVSVADVVAACRLAASRGVPGEAYNVGTGHPTSVLELLRAVQAGLDAPPDVRFGPRRAGDLDTSCADVTGLAALGFVARVPLGDGLAETARWYRDQLVR